MSDSTIEELMEELDTDDVGQKRYLMYRIFDLLLDELYENSDREAEVQERVQELRSFDGYMYKLAQEFLTSSSTLEKRRKLEKMIEHVRAGEPGES